MVGLHDAPPPSPHTQEALPAQIHVVYIIQPGHFWKKTATSRGHNKEKKKLEFSVSHALVCALSYRKGMGLTFSIGRGSLLPRPHPLTRKNDLVNQVNFLGLAHAFAKTELPSNISNILHQTHSKKVRIPEWRYIFLLL